MYVEKGFRQLFNEQEDVTVDKTRNGLHKEAAKTTRDVLLFNG